MDRLRFLGRYLLIPIAFIILLFAFYWVYKDVIDRTISEYTNEQLILAETASRGISSFFIEYQSDLEFLSRFDDIRKFSEGTKILMADFYNDHKDIIVATTRVDSNGIILYTYPENHSVIGNDISYQDHVKQIIATRQPVISDVFLSAQGYRAIALHVPIFNNNQFNGSLAILIPIDRLGKLYLGQIKIRGNGEAWLLSENGIELYCPLMGHTGKPFPEPAQADFNGAELIERISKETYGTVIGLHPDPAAKSSGRFSEKYIAFYRVPISNTYWTILISCQEEAIYEALTRFRNRLVLLFSLFLVIISFYVFSIVKARNVLKEEAKRKKAEKTLMESEEKFRRIFEDHTAVKLLIDPETGKIMDANNSASSYYGWTREDLRQMNIRQINTLSADEIRIRMQNVLNDDKNHFEFRHRLKNGTIRDVEVLTSKIRIGNKVLLHSIIHDITERKQIEKELIESKEHAEESDRLKTAFLQNMSHEIRTPMNAIMGFSSLITDYYDNKPKLEKFAEIINSRCNDLLEIINGILDISKIESGQLTVRKENCDLNELFEELSQFFEEHQIRLGKQHISLNIKAACYPSISYISIDKVKLRQIFINLIGNAFKYTDKGKIEGGCRMGEDGELVFYVSDTGIGIPADKQDKVFQRFVQLHDDDRLTYGGTGLGLSIVKGLVDLMEGKIWLESATGKGTIFYFKIPH